MDHSPGQCRLLQLQAPHPRRGGAAEGAVGGLRQPQGLAKPQVCYETLPVVETFLRIGIGCPACSPGASCLPTLPASLSSFPDSLLCLCLSLQTCLSHLNR